MQPIIQEEVSRNNSLLNHGAFSHITHQLQCLHTIYEAQPTPELEQFISKAENLVDLEIRHHMKESSIEPYEFCYQILTKLERLLNQKKYSTLIQTPKISKWLEEGFKQLPFLDEIALQNA